MVSKYLLIHYSIRDGEIEYGDKVLVEMEVKPETTEEVIDLALKRMLGNDNFGEENDDWELNEDGQVEGCGGEYRILELEDKKEIPKEHFDILKLYMMAETLTV